MRTSDVAALAASLAATDIDALELTGPGVALRLRRGGEPPPAAPAPAVPPAPPAEGARASAAGLFLSAHPLRDAPMVQPGDRVAAGQVLGFLRVGPLLLPVAAPRDGVVSVLPVPPGTAVGYGTLLVPLDPPPA